MAEPDGAPSNAAPQTHVIAHFRISDDGRHAGYCLCMLPARTFTQRPTTGVDSGACVWTLGLGGATPPRELERDARRAQSGS